MKYAVILLGLFFLAACGGKDFETYTDQVNGYSIDFPAGWDTTSQDNRMAFMFKEGFTDSLDFYSEGFSISAFFNEGKSLDEIVMENIHLTKYYYGDITIKQDKLTNDNEISYSRLELNYEIEGLTLTNLAAFAMNKDKLVTLTFSVEQTKVDNYRELFQTVINSLKWVD